MKKFLLLLFCYFIAQSAVNAQVFHVLEGTPTQICDTSLTGGIPSDTMYLCLQGTVGTVVITDSCATYTPNNANYFGYDVICLTTCIGGICSDSTINITILPVNEIIIHNTPEDANTNICENVLTGGSNVNFTTCGAPQLGTVAFNPACVVYAPPPIHYVGKDTMCVVACRDTLCDTITLVMNMTPVTETITRSVPGNSSFTICYPQLSTWVDTVTSISLTCGPTNGTVAINSLTNCIEYTPNATYAGTGLSGTDQICIRICNSEGICDITNVSITITDFTVLQNNIANQLAQSLTGTGVVVSGAFLNCPGNSSGFFFNANNNLGIADGIVLGTGLVSNIDNAPGFQPSTSMVSPGDANLNAILTSQGLTYGTNDACALEFDVEVLGDSLKFNYVFSSEEYPENGVGEVDDYVCSINDIFAFFVTGNNPAGGTYNNVNVATIPGTAPPIAVSINTINDGTEPHNPPQCYNTFTSLYNGTVPNIAFDGNTNVLEAKFATIPCNIYHFKLVIADGSDNVWDSGVFLEAGSFSSLPVTIASSTVLGNGFTNAVEDCVDGVFTFELIEPLTSNYVVDFVIAGTATNGIDYTLIPDSVIIPAGDSVFSISIEPITDALNEGTETVTIYLMNNCTGLPLDSASLSIIDLIPFNLVATEDTICPGDVVTLTATIAGDDNDLAVYSWTSSSGNILTPNSSITNVSANATNTYYVEYTLGSCTKTDSITIYVPTFTYDIDTNFISCPGANDGGFAISPIGAIGNVSYVWSPVASIDSFIENIGPDTFYVTIQDQSGLSCHTLLDTLIMVEPNGLTFTYEVDNVTCFGLDNGSVTVNDLTASTSFEVIVMYNGTTFPTQTIVSDAAGSYFIDNLIPGNYDSITITNPVTGCNNSFSFVITEPDTLVVDITTPGAVLCAGGAIDTLLANATGGTLSYTYLWNNGSVSNFITGMGVGTYWVVVTDSNFCTASDTFIVSQPNPLFFSLQSDSASCYNTNDGFAFVDSISGGTAPYAYAWSANAGSQVNDTAFNLLPASYTLTVTDFNGCQEQETVNIFSTAPLTFSRIVTNISCNGGGDGEIDITVGGGQAPYTYDWNGPSYFSSNDDINGLLAGTYDFILTDDNGCTLDTSVVITQPTALALSTTQVNISCKGLANGSATITTTGGTAPYTYLWDDAAAQVNATANNLLVGSYEVVVTDDNGCQDSLSVTLTEPADSLELTLISVSNVLCNGGNTGAVQVSTAGGTPSYSYSWSNLTSNEDLSNAVAGTYTLTVTDNNGCQDVLSATITQPTALNIVLSASSVSCFGASTGAVNATISGATAPYSFAWVGPNFFSAAIEDITNLAAGTYTLTVTDDNGCSASQSAIVTQPANVSIGFSSVAVSCFGGNDGSLTASVISGGTAPFTFQWDAAANNQVGATATGLLAGTYQVTVSDNNGCAYSNSGTVTQPNLPLTISLSGTDITCAGYNNGTVSVTASGGTPGYTYLWNDPQGQTNATATNLAPGTYQVTVTDINACFEIDTISIIEPEAIGIVAIGDSTNCFGDATGSISITASGGSTLGYAYSIDGGETFQNSPDFFNLPAGVYNEVVVQDLGSVDLCLSPEITVTIFEQPFFSFEVVPGDTTLQLEESVTLELVVNSPFYDSTAITQVVWFPSTGLNCSDCIDPTVLTYDNYTEYVATVYYEGGDNELCSAISSTVIIVENNLQLFVPNAFTPGSFDNVNEVFEVYGEGIEYITMQIYNRWGEKIFESSNQRVAWDGKYQGALQNPGVYTYYVNVEYLDGKQVERKGSVTLIR